MDHVDLVFCHRPDPETPVEETVWAMNDIVASAKLLLGTSEWSATTIREAWDIADRRNLRKPQMEQPQYNMLSRNKVEKEFARLYDGIGLGLTTWSPLASGLLTGKYNKRRPGRLALQSARLRLAQGPLAPRRYFKAHRGARTHRQEPGLHDEPARHCVGCA